ncbi:MAG: PEP-CTERM sorting domain-containing protein, partial [Candidatus Scalindua sp.]|nr:PEP-CTERM sorting domain-containing protein [Candidatus Scalindua sp.]
QAIVSVPEPSTMVLLLIGCVGICFFVIKGQSMIYLKCL